MEIQEESNEQYHLEIYFSKETVPKSFKRLENGEINFGGLDSKIIMVELRGGARYVGLVASGKNEEWILHTGYKLESNGRRDCVGGISIDDYVFPLGKTRYQVVKNKDETSMFKSFLRTRERSLFDIRKDTTIFERLFPSSLSDFFQGF